MIISFAGDRGCLEGIGYALKSIAENTRDFSVRLYLWDCQNDACTAKVTQIIEDSGLRDGVEVIASEELLAGHGLRDFIDGNRYFQILVPFLDKRLSGPVLYLDHDVLVLNDLKGLATWNLSAKPAAMAADFVIASRPATEPERNKRLGRAEQLPYFNSGIFLANANWMRSENIAEKTAEYFLADPARCICPDQCALNAVLGERCAELPFSYNWQTMGQRYFPNFKAEIVHFTGKWKPWRQTSWFHPDEVKRLCGLSTNPIYSVSGPDLSKPKIVEQWLSKFSLSHLPSHASKRKALAERFNLTL